MSRYSATCHIIDQVRLAQDIFHLVVDAPDIARVARPGQFCMLATAHGGGLDPLLRRPLSIHDAWPSGRLEFLYRVVGKGTDLLSQKGPGETVCVLGPLGRGFRPEPCGKSILVGGGLGAAPLLFLARSLDRMDVTVILGGRSIHEIARLDAFEGAAGEVLVTTEDGSRGIKGLVTTALERLDISSSSHTDAIPCVFACGPWPMMKAVYAWATAKGIAIQVSLETQMACGTGVCLGCAIRPSTQGRYLHTCKDGPVFFGTEIDWG